MKLIVNQEAGTLAIEEDGKRRECPLFSAEAFAELSRLWVQVGWSQRYSYSFTWLGRPVVQLPEDLIRIQEAIFQLKPDVLVETGVAHGGSLVFYASVFKALGRGRVIGVDIEIQPENRTAIESHELAALITLVDGSSTDPEVIGAVRDAIAPGECVMVVLDSNHTRAHVRSELDAYHELVSRGSYIVATDGVMRDLVNVPGGKRGWADDNPAAAARDFLSEHGDEFVLEPPVRLFDESSVAATPTYWPDAWIKRRDG